MNSYSVPMLSRIAGFAEVTNGLGRASKRDALRMRALIVFYL